MQALYYGKEPFDLRLALLRLVRKIWLIVAITIIGTLAFGGGYYVKNIVLQGESSYAATSVYKVNFVQEPSASGDYYINTMTWNTYAHSEEFLTPVWDRLNEMTKPMEETGAFAELTESPDELADSPMKLADFITVDMESDIHVPSTIVTTGSPEWSLMLAKAVEETMVDEFVAGNEQVESIKVITPATDATKIVPDVRPVRALILSAILSCFFAIVVILLKEWADDSIWLPATLRKRYGLIPLGTVHSPELASNMNYVVADSTKIMVCSTDDTVDTKAVAELLTELAGQNQEETDQNTFTVQKIDTLQAKESSEDAGEMKKQWIPVPAPLLCTETCTLLQQAEKVILVVPAGNHVGKTLEYVLEYFATQEITVSAVLLWEADEWLLRSYYRLPAND